MISVLWFKNHINGFRFMDDKGNYIVDETWYSCKGVWETKTVPPGSELIGFAVNIDSLSFSIPVISFMLWCPSVKYDAELNQIEVAISEPLSPLKKQRNMARHSLNLGLNPG